MNEKKEESVFQLLTQTISISGNMHKQSKSLMSTENTQKYKHKQSITKQFYTSLFQVHACTRIAVLKDTKLFHNKATKVNVYLRMAVYVKIILHTGETKY